MVVMLWEGGQGLVRGAGTIKRVVKWKNLCGILQNGVRIKRRAGSMAYTETHTMLRDFKMNHLSKHPCMLLLQASPHA